MREPWATQDGTPDSETAFLVRERAGVHIRKQELYRPGKVSCRQLLAEDKIESHGLKFKHP